MDKEKQKIVSDICPFYKEYGTCDRCNTELDIDGEPCYFECMANAIIRNGYKKAEWISVDERLPEDDLPKDTNRRTIRCLVATNKGSVKACVRQRYILVSTGELSSWCWSKDIFATPTHWMPLPEPPKGE